MAAVEGGRLARSALGQCIHGHCGPRGSTGAGPVPLRRCHRGPQLADARRLGRRRGGGAAARLPGRLPQLRHDLRLVWGRELAHGSSPDHGAALPPTPHPLADLFGLVTTPLGDGAIDLTMVLAYVSLGLVGFLVYRLGSLWFDRWIGAVAAAIVLTRAPFLSNGLRAYVDLPYIALCLGALLIEAKRPRAGWPVLALLALAGLLRPEAWLFSVRLPRLPRALTRELSGGSAARRARRRLPRAGGYSKCRSN